MYLLSRRHEYPGENEQTEHFHEEGEDKIEFSYQEGNTIRLAHMEFRCIKRSAEYQADESEKNQSVHYAGIDVSECLNLKQAVFQKQFDSLLDLVISDSLVCR